MANNIVEVDVGEQVQRLFVGVILPVATLFIWYFLFKVPFETIEYVFLTSALCAIPLVAINLITEILQRHNTFLFFVFSILVLVAYVGLTLLTFWLMAFFWCIVPGWLMTLPVLRWHYVCHHKKHAMIERSRV